MTLNQSDSNLESIQNTLVSKHGRVPNPLPIGIQDYFEFDVFKADNPEPSCSQGLICDQLTMS